MYKVAVKNGQRKITVIKCKPWSTKTVNGTTDSRLKKHQHVKGFGRVPRATRAYTRSQVDAEAVVGGLWARERHGDPSTTAPPRPLNVHVSIVLRVYTFYLSTTRFWLPRPHNNVILNTRVCVCAKTPREASPPATQPQPPTPPSQQQKQTKRIIWMSASPLKLEKIF